MISGFNVLKDKITLRDFLKECHLSNSNIYKLSLLDAFYNDNEESIGLDTVLYRNDLFYINFSLLEKSDCLYNEKYHDIDIIYEDSNIIAVYKDNGILVHGDGTKNVTLLDRVKGYLKSNNDDSVVRALHRLDVDTSGVVIFTKNILAHAYLSNQMEENKIEKEYLAYVLGNVEKNGYVDIGIGKDRHNSKKSIAIKTGKYAYTEYEVLNTNKSKSLLKIKIKTGRTHQIRVHMAYIKHPIIGDSLYGLKDGKLMLMCKRMEFELFGEKIIVNTEREF